jgi:hypothetical protein
MDEPADFSTRIARNELQIQRLEQEIVHTETHGASSALLHRVASRLLTENEILRAWASRSRRPGPTESGA